MNLSLTKRVKLIKSEIDVENDLIIWDLLFLDNQVTQRFCWNTTDLVESFGLKISKLPIEIVEKFCNDMLNKEFNMQFNQVANAFPHQEISEEEKINVQRNVYKHFNSYNQQD